jgi:hypothetical protein
MAVYRITFHQRLDNYAVVQTLTEPDVAVGQSITIADLGHSLNGTHVIYDLPSYYFLGVDSEGDLLFDVNQPIPNQVLFYDAGDNLDRSSTNAGTLTYTETCTWITAVDIENYLTVPLLGSNDQTFLVQCAAAANAFCFRRRQESGYTDDLTVSPGGDVTLGTIMYGSALFRQKGSIDQFASFTDMGSAPTVGLSGLVKQLLGISRPQVA